MKENRFLNYMQNFFKTRSAGFYVLLGGIVLSLIEAIVYYVSYAMQNEYAEYFSLAAFIIVFVAIIVTIALSLFETTERFAAVVFCAFEICIFFLFVEKTYLYLPTVFYHGFSAVALASLYPGFTACFIMLIAGIIAGIVATFMKTKKKDKRADTNEKSYANKEEN